jgi:uncharacterized protein YfiM (DUF2279 family)
MKVLLDLIGYILKDYLPDWLGFDKVLHFSACFMISVFGLVPAVFAAGLAIGKETGDYFNKDSGWSWRDLIADGIGIAAGLGLHFIVKLF